MNCEDNMINEAWSHRKLSIEKPRRHPSLEILDSNIENILARIKDTPVDHPRHYPKMAETLARTLPIQYPADAILNRMTYLRSGNKARKEVDENLGPLGAAGVGTHDSGAIYNVQPSAI